MELIFATNNLNKLKEIRHSVNRNVKILSLSDCDINVDIPEDFETLEENAEQKALFINQMTSKNTFADDTGLEVRYLNGRPGVYSARYAGPSCKPEDNMDKLLFELGHSQDRHACFRTIISLVYNKGVYFFEGKVNGKITNQKRGIDGFGYDPIFQPEGYNETFAEMSLELKNSISHRGKAVQKLLLFINTHMV